VKSFAVPSLILTSTSWSEHKQLALKENTIFCLWRKLEISPGNKSEKYMDYEGY